MSDLNLALRQVRYENKSFWRNPAAAFFTFAFPLMFLVIFNLAFGSETIETRQGSISVATAFIIPAITVFSVVSACYTNIAMTVTIARDEGVLKRIRATPLPPWAFLFGRILHAVLIALLLVVIVVAAGLLFYGVDLPTKTMPAFIVTLIVGAATFCSLGMAITPLLPNAEAATAIVNASILPLLFVSDVFMNIETPWIVSLSNLFPVRHFSHALQVVFNPYTEGAGFQPLDLAVMGAWLVVGILVAARYFDWEPRR
jgi:ABC-2 type transport system permease protein